MSELLIPDFMYGDVGIDVFMRGVLPPERELPQPDALSYKDAVQFAHYLIEEKHEKGELLLAALQKMKSVR